VVAAGERRRPVLQRRALAQHSADHRDAQQPRKLRRVCSAARGHASPFPRHGPEHGGERCGHQPRSRAKQHEARASGRRMAAAPTWCSSTGAGTGHPGDPVPALYLVRRSGTHARVTRRRTPAACHSRPLQRLRIATPASLRSR
jgi:hypothetical protein